MASRRQQQSMNYRAAKKAADAKYKPADTRPQDDDKKFRNSQILKNTTEVDAVTWEYEAQLDDYVRRHALPPCNSVAGDRKDKCNELTEALNVHDKTRTDSVLEKLMKQPVLAVDFEFHDQYTYDGFICVASVSASNKCFVIDSILPRSNPVIQGLVTIMESTETLKVFCGMDNDILRLRKDWGCHPQAAVDIQDMFIVWKNQDFEDCYYETNQFLKKGGGGGESSLREFLRTYDKPALDFFFQVYFGSGFNKDHTATFADWRKRPLHPELIQYAAVDSFHLWEIFHFLYHKIGETGLREAIRLGFKKLTTVAKLRKHKEGTPSYSYDEVTAAVMDWRKYLGQHLDKSMDQILRDHQVGPLVDRIRNNRPVDSNYLASFLAELRVGDDVEKAAKLLLIYLDPTARNRLREMDCHKCNKEGHVAEFCPFEHELFGNSAKRENSKREKYAEAERANRARRRRNYMLKLGRDPDRDKAPWEEKPFH